MFRTLDACKSGDCKDCPGTVIQSAERISANEAMVEVTCTHECHEADSLAVVGGEAGC